MVDPLFVCSADTDMQVAKSSRYICGRRHLLPFVEKNRWLISLLPLCFAMILVSCQTILTTRLSMDDQGAILSAAEKTFILMNEKRYGDVWGSISEKSKDAVIGTCSMPARPFMSRATAGNFGRILQKGA
jgi:hypothetical protein